MSWYTCTYSSTMVGFSKKIITLDSVAHSTRVPMVHMYQVLEYHGNTCTYKYTNITFSQKRLEPWYSSSTRVRTYVRTYHGARVPWYQWYTCTNITLSQKQLEIQALRCNVPWYHIWYTCTMVLWDVHMYVRTRLL